MLEKRDMFNKILIANRGEIACRIIRTAKQLGIRCVAIYSDVDVHAQHVKLADEAYSIGGKTSTESYLNQEKILAIAREAKVDAVHPGYGFLSENAEFAEKCTQSGIVFIGPPAEVILAMGSKSRAKTLMEDANVPVIPGYHGHEQEPDVLAKEANKIGYPVLIKAVAGGGGKGMRVVFSSQDFNEALAGAKREALSAFGCDDMLLEKYLPAPRHIEIQIFADTHGNIVHLFERDCSIQRRHQKIIEESPAANFTEKLRNQMTKAAILAVRAMGYIGAGTLEFLVDNDQFYFMEMNTRLQVEHPVTEKITGIDLVEWQLRVAAGESLPLLQSQISIHGHAVEARIYAEDPEKEFLPATGSIYFLQTPEEDKHLRLDTGVAVGDVITPYYDPMLGKLIAWGETRADALRYLQQGLAAYQFVGLTTNRNFLQHIVKQADFLKGTLSTRFINDHLHDLLIKKSVSAFVMIALTMYILLMQKKDVKATALETSDPYSPWAFADAWRLNSVAVQTLCFCYFDETLTVHVIDSDDNFDLTFDGKTYSGNASLIENGVLIALSNREYVTHIIGYQDKYHLFLEDETAVIKRYIPSLASHTQESKAHLTAPLPGTVIAVFAKEGDRVEAGSNLVIIEAMKMEHTIRAPYAGVVKRWCFNVGDLVNEGEELLVFEEVY